ncbi:PEP-CTERM sorting domain-containing protein [Alteromonas sp. KS69]|uniref:exosortase-dependent surface protein XDP1 n=1 Tax=Alteromonas sp. KS69 TaxID=2109917 RepID=UPI000F86F390|nr:exosortase-dependent surface protein XDP1 [Alteromonas sp. KS69]RUP76777.1 PEP-CTERM sorting domain-containing protein [Alteromonas sp. KS69]
MKHMKGLTSFAFSVAVLLTGNVLADDSLSEATYSLSENGITQTLTPSASHGSVINIDGTDVYVGITAWSDTGNLSSSSSEDTKLDQGDIKGWSEYGNVGYGILNDDYSWGGDSHSADNYNDKGKDDFDMFLLSFSEDVTLQGSSFSWVNGNNGTKEVTVAGLSDINSFSDSVESTWASVSSSIVAGTLGHFGIGSRDSSTKLYESKFTTLTNSAKYWLVGAYNTVFDDSSSTYHGVGFKLSSLDLAIQKSTTPPPAPTPVSEPGALALMSIGLGLLAYRRKRRV